MSKKLIIFGGNGALGSKCVSTFKQNGWWVGCIDTKENKEADVNISLQSELKVDEGIINKSITNILFNDKLNAIICVAGGWKNGNAKKSLVHDADLMWKKSTLPSLLSASLATNHLQNNGVLILSGAASALNDTPTMIGYGLAKSCVHHLCKSLANAKKSGMPENSTTLAILPTVLDTPQNRKMMSSGDFSSWTPLEFVANLLLKWCERKEVPNNGSLIKFVTKNNSTKLVYC